MEDGGGASSEVRTVSSQVPTSPNAALKKLLVFKVYKRRWFVLLVLCLLNCSNATVSEVTDKTVKFSSCFPDVCGQSPTNLVSVRLIPELISVDLVCSPHTPSASFRKYTHTNLPLKKHVFYGGKETECTPLNVHCMEAHLGQNKNKRSGERSTQTLKLKYHKST